MHSTKKAKQYKTMHEQGKYEVTSQLDHSRTPASELQYLANVQVSEFWLAWGALQAFTRGGGPRAGRLVGLALGESAG